MQVSLKKIAGLWDVGWVLDKHIVSSVFLGNNESGRPQFDTTRTAAGEATFQLKYRRNWSQAMPLAQAVADNIYPMLEKVGFIVPMPASTTRARQPVTEVANELGKLVNKPVFDNLLLKTPNGKPLKDIISKEEKIEAIGNSFSIHDGIEGNGPWNVLIVDDLFDTGASMEAACRVMRTYPKVRQVYVAALTWK